MPAAFRDFQGEAGAKRAAVLVRVATQQAKLGDRAAAARALRLAEQAAESIENASARASALAEIAGATEPGMARQAWSKALEFASTIADPWHAGRATETILRARAGSGGFDEALRMVGEGLKGDLRSFALWVVADEMARSAKAAPAAPLKVLLGLAESAEFDRYPKKAKVLARAAEAQAASGDSEGAERTVGKLNSENSARHYRFLRSRVDVLVLVARSQIKAGAKDAAKVTLHVALDIVAPFRGDDGGSSFPLEEIAETFARAGDVAAAVETAGGIPSASSRVSALTAVATAQAEAGDRPGAAKTLDLAASAVADIPGETLWTTDAPMRSGLGMDAGVMMKVRALKDLTIARAKTGDLAGSIKSLAAMTAEGGPSRRFEQVEATEQIVLVQAGAGDFAGALKTVDSLARMTRSPTRRRGPC